MSELISNPTQKELFRQEMDIYNKGVAFADAGSEFLGSHTRIFEFEGNWFKFTAQGSFPPDESYPRLFISRVHKDNDGLTWSDTVYRLDPSGHPMLHVREDIALKADNVAPLYSNSFSIRGDSEHTYISECIRDDQPVNDPQERDFVYRLSTAALYSLAVKLDVDVHTGTTWGDLK